MSDAQPLPPLAPPVTFEPSATTLIAEPAPPAHDHDHDPTPGAVRFEPAAKDDKTTVPAAAPVPPPAPIELPLDPQSNLPYRPLVLGGLTYRCTPVLTAGFLMQLARAQADLAAVGPLEKATGAQQMKVLDLFDSIIDGVMWDDDIPKLRAALSNKMAPIGMSEYRDAINELMTAYQAPELGKGQQG